MKTYSSLGSPGRNFSRAASVTSVRFVTAAAPFDGWFSWPGVRSVACAVQDAWSVRKHGAASWSSNATPAHATMKCHGCRLVPRTQAMDSANLSALSSTWTSQPNASDMTNIGAEM